MNQLLITLICSSLALGPAWPKFSHAAEKPVVNAGDDSDPSDIIEPGHLLRLVSPEDPKITGDYRVGLNGRVSLPYDVSVKASGLRVKALEAMLAKSYQPYFRSTPKISVSIKERKYWVKVLGLVRNPGPYLVSRNATLGEAISMADVRTEDLEEGYARVTGRGQDRWVRMEDYLRGGIDLPAWRGGETISFQKEKPEGAVAEASAAALRLGPAERKIQVLGEVRSPGEVTYQQSADAYYYLIQRGGPTRDSDLGKVELLRRQAGSMERKSVAIGDLGVIKNVQESDVIIVHPDRPSKFEKGLQYAGIFASILSAVAVSIYLGNNNK